MATTRGRGMRREGRRPGLERLEGRALLNASIDIAADGSLIYRTDPGAVESLLVSRAGGVYTFAVDPANNPIDVTSNAAGLAVTGSGGRTVTVTGPSTLRIEARADGQTIRVRSTGVATQVVLQADSERVILGDDQAAGSGGIQALAGPITVSAAVGSEMNSLLVADGPAAYDAGSRPSYVVSAGTITSNDPTVQSRFAGITYAGVSTLTLRGTTVTTVGTPLYVVQDTADGVATTIDASAGPATRDISVLGTSSVATSRLTLISSGTSNVGVASIDAPVTFIGNGGRASIRLESVRGGNYGIDSDFVVINGSGGGVDLAVGNFFNLGAPRGTTNWFLGFAPGSTEYVALRDADNPAVGGLFFRPGEAHSLGVDARGNRGASLMVDLRNGDPLPFAPPNGRPGEPTGGFTYVGAAANHPGSPYALSLVGSPTSGPFASAVHRAFPYYRGQIELADGGSTRNIAYQLSAGAPVLDDSSNVADYRWFYDIMHGAVDGVRTRPDGTTESAIVESDLGVTAGGIAIGGGQSLSVRERNANVPLARYLFSGKNALRIQRGWSLGGVTTTVDYQPTPEVDADGLPVIPPVAGLASLYVTDESPASQPTNDVVRLQNLPPAAAAYVDQGYGDDAGIVSLSGAVGATLVSFAGASNTPPTPTVGGDVLYIDAGRRRIESSTFQVVAPGVLRIPALSPDDAPLTLGGYEEVQVFNSSAPTFTIQPVSIPATARVPLVDVTAGVLTASIAGFSPGGLSAVIAWGDGTGSSGRIEAVPGAPGTYRVVGTHAYTVSGVFSPRIILSGAGTATSTVSGVEVVFQVTGTSGTAAPAPALAGRLAAASDSGVSDSDRLTNVVRPTFQGTSATPGAWIAVYATPAGGTAPQIYLGATVADAAGSWSVASIATLPDGAYTVQATSASTSTWANGLANLADPLVIDTIGPRVWGVSLAALRGEVIAELRDFGGQADSGVGLDLNRLRDLASYGFAADRGATIPLTSVLVAPGSTNRSQTVTLRPASARLRNGAYVLTVRSSAGSPTAGVRDLAGNPLDGAFAGTFPSGGANTGRDFRARLDLFNNRLRSIRPVG
ncbi:Ig-like domain-containing protein [Paludisphaera soli]|uniref:Ig-like domain-containing protein n=1 Tax=Paludisphaera soli TaxID=2712865 RepID=UPI0013EA8A6F|nr:Ig-like domain-containing protein [Paludisphaera soli]